MNQVNRTLYIPLYGKAWVSRRGLLLSDPDAEAIWDASGFPLNGRAASKWLAYTMAMRSSVFDNWLRQNLTPGAVVLHLGCGLDSRFRRVVSENPWFDVDFPAVIEERKRYFPESETYRMIGCDLRRDWLKDIPAGGTAVVVMEGVSMYLTAGERQALLRKLRDHFREVRLLMDAYTVFAARASKYKNPINEVGVTQVYGFDDPREPEAGSGLGFLREHDMTPDSLIKRLPAHEQRFFRLMFAGKAAKKLYRIYEYQSTEVTS